MDKNIIDINFDNWTRDRTDEEKIVNIFSEVQRVPYKIIPALANYKTGPEGLLLRGKGSCEPKHFLLGLFYERLGLKVEYVTHAFHWSHLKIDYPDEIKKITLKMPEEYHLCLRVRCKEKNIIVDATWDKDLEKIGVPITKYWNLQEDTHCGVLSLRETIHQTQKERDEFVSNKRKTLTPEEKKDSTSFIIAFNKWLDEIRER